MAFFLLMLLPLCLGGRWSRFLRVLVPCWRFFESVEHGHQLWMRNPGEPWRPVQNPVPGCFLYNPDALLELACRDLVHALTSDLDGLEPGQHASIGRLTSYRLVHNLVRQRGCSGFKLVYDGQDVFQSA